MSSKRGSTSAQSSAPPSSAPVGSSSTGESSLTTICTAIERGNLDRKSKLESTGRLCYELKNDPLLLDEFPMDRVMRCMRRLAADNDTSTRQGALRVLRYCMNSRDNVKSFVDLYIPVFVVRAMERDQKQLAERVQAIKVVRRVMEIDASQMPTALVASLVAIANHKDDNLRRISLETLRELALCNTEVVAEANGIRVLVDAILEPSFQDVADSLIYTMLMVLNEPATRRYVDPFIDSQVLLAPFTDTDLPAGNERRQRWMASRNAIVKMMRSWTGIVVLTSNPQGLKSLIQLLVKPVGEDVQKAVLSTICEIFYKKAPFDATSTESTDSSATTVPISVMATDNQPLTSQLNVLDNYTVVILLGMIHCGILDALLTLGIGPSRELAEPAVELLSDILRMSSRLLPDQQCASLLALPGLVSATSLTTTTTQPLGNYAKSLIERLQREKSIRASEMLGELATAVGASSGSVASRGVSLVSYGSSGVNGVQLASELLRDTNRPSLLPFQQQPLQRSTSSSSTVSSSLSLQRKSSSSSRELMVQELKLSMDAQIDDSTFKEMLHNRSRVLTDKNWTKWNWDIISELLEGPLTNPQRLSEAMKTKFFKRLSGFFRCDPGNKGYFSQLPWIPDFVPFLRPACQMYTLLLNHQEGLLFLKTDRRGQLLREISTALELEARPEAAIVESHIGVLKERMFSPEYCSRRMLREYFTLLGLMSSSKEGLKMMEQSNLFQRLYVMGTTKGHDFLCRLILANLDYSVDGGSRKLLLSWMMEGSKALRLYATCLLRALLRSEVADFAKWGIDALVIQLTQEEEVARAALSVLEEAAETHECLLAMVSKRPTKLTQLKDKRAESLLLKFLSLPEGLSFLRETDDWIPHALSMWRREKYISYVQTVEHALFRALQRDVSGRDRSSATMSNTTKSVPTPIPVQVPMKRGSGASKGSTQSLWGLDWIYRMPWNMEVKIIGPPGSGPPSNLILETYIDGSMREEEETPIDEDDLRANSIRVKGIVVDARNIPQPVIVNSQQTLQACLFLGTQPVDRRGFTKPPPQSSGGFVMSSGGFSSDTQSKSRTRSTSATADRSSESGLGSSFDMNESSMPAPESVAEENKDWSICQPDQRNHQTLPSPDCSVCAPGERAVWNFRVETDTGSAGVRRVRLKSVEFTLQLLPLRPRSVPLPPHLYGELAKTSNGCDILHNSGHVPDFIESLRDPATVPLEKRAALWALGHVAATAQGYELIQRHAPDVVDMIVKLATHSPIVSVRGTCFYVLGLIARCSAGRNHLSRLGWDSARDPRASIAVPHLADTLFKWPTREPPGMPRTVTQTPKSNLQTLLRNVPPEWREVLRYVADLSNHITQKEAHSNLNKLRALKSPLFEEPMLLLYIHALLERYNYRSALRQFVLNAFEKATLTDDVLDSIRDESAEYRTSSGVKVPPPPSLLRRRSVTSVPSFTSTVQTLNVSQVNGRASGANGLSLGVSSSRASMANGRPSVADGLTSSRATGHHEMMDRAMLLKRNRKRRPSSDRIIAVGAPEATV